LQQRLQGGKERGGDLSLGRGGARELRACMASLGFVEDGQSIEQGGMLGAAGMMLPGQNMSMAAAMLGRNGGGPVFYSSPATLGGQQVNLIITSLAWATQPAVCVHLRLWIAVVLYSLSAAVFNFCQDIFLEYKKVDRIW
jgi:hypothetical protein